MSKEVTERTQEFGDIIEKRKISYQVSKYIQNMIINNELKSGERIVETKIAKQLGISQTPVREALRELETMGLVEIKPYLGCFVKSITQKELYQAYHLRSLLESFAVSHVGNIREPELKMLGDKIKQMEYAQKANDKDLFGVYDVEFHEIIVKSAKNPLLERMWRMASVAQWTALTIETAHKPIEFFTELHKPICDCLSNGDYQGAQKEIENHFTICLDLVKASFLKE